MLSRLKTWWRCLLIDSPIGRRLPFIKRITCGHQAILHRLGDRAIQLPLADLHRYSQSLSRIDASTAIDLTYPFPKTPICLPAIRKIKEIRDCELNGDSGLRRQIELSYLAAPLQKEEELLVCPGSTGALLTILDTLVRPGDKVIVFDPCSPIYPLILQHRQAKVIRVPCQLQEGKLQIDASRLRKAMRQAKILLFSDPNNPLGASYSPEILEQIAYFAAKQDLLILYDRTFAINGEQKGAFELSALPHTRNRLCTIDSMSYRYGLPHLRIGWLRAPASLIRAASLTQIMNAGFVSTYTQQLGEEVIQKNPHGIINLHRIIQERKMLVQKHLKAIDLPVEIGDAGPFIWCPLQKKGVTGTELSNALAHRFELLVQAGEPFGTNGNDYFRIALGTDDSRLSKGLTIITDYLASCNASKEDQKNLSPDKAIKKHHYGHYASTPKETTKETTKEEPLGLGVTLEATLGPKNNISESHQKVASNPPQSATSPHRSRSSSSAATLAENATSNL